MKSSRKKTSTQLFLVVLDAPGTRDCSHKLRFGLFRGSSQEDVRDQLEIRPFGFRSCYTHITPVGQLCTDIEIETQTTYYDDLVE